MPFLGRTPTQLVDPEVDINGGAIDGVTIGATSASPATVTTFTSTGIDDNATSTAVTIASGGDVTINGTDASTSIASPAILNLKAGDANNEYSTLRFATSADGSIGYIGAKATTTGAYPNSVGNLQLGVQNGGSTVTAMTIDNSGNVGIGTNSPTRDLQVEGVDPIIVSVISSTTGAGIGFKDSTTTGDNVNTIRAIGNQLQLRADNNLSILTGGGSERLRIDSSGNVGIGTTSPDNKFHVVSGSAGEVAQFTGEIEARGLSIRSETNTDASAHVVFNSQSGGSKGMFTFETDSTERMRIDSSGNVGIGLASPAKQLHLYSANSGGTTTPLLLQNNGGSGTVVELRLAPSVYDNDIGSTARWSAIQAINGGSGNPTSLAFLTNGISSDPTERMRINSSGNVGIGTSSPERILHTSTSNDYVAKFESTDSFAGIILEDNNSTTNGNVIAVSGDNMLFYTANGQRLRLRSDGGICFNGDSAAANALDDYEEGTWTPTIEGSSSNPTGITYSYQTGQYTKIGRQVTVHFRIQTTAGSGGSGTLRISNIPFTASSVRSSGVISFSRRITNGGGPLTIHSYESSSVFNLYKYTDADDFDTAITLSDITTFTGLVLHGSFTYYAT